MVHIFVYGDKMQVINAAKILNQNPFLDELVLGEDNDLSIDFSDIDKITMNDVSTLSNLKKIAVLNKKHIKISNATANVMQVLDITGLNRTSGNHCTNPISEN